MNSVLKSFFKEITSNKNLQERLYHTKNISDVALIANELGFNISATEVLKAQACRLIELVANKPEEAQMATAGKKPNLGAQWGREGTGFLERAGYWLIQFHHWECYIQSFNPDLTRLLLQIDQDSTLQSKLIASKTMDEVSTVTQENGFSISAIALLTYQALCVLQLNDQHADLVAQGVFE